MQMCGTTDIINLSDAETGTLGHILRPKNIRTVYQPIVSLSDGSVFGYEALSRVAHKNIDIPVEQLLKAADYTGETLELETAFRNNALKDAVEMASDKKLFINMNPNTIYTDVFQNEFTKTLLKENGLNFRNVIIEITERALVEDNIAFLDAVKNYKRQNCGIAIDDVGSGYFGLKTLSEVKPNFIKIDIDLVKNINKDETKKLLCKAMVDFGKSTGIKLIAEGIETQQELETVISLGVDYGQGFFLGIPREGFTDISPEKRELILKLIENKYFDGVQSVGYPIIGRLSKNIYNVSPDERTETIYEKVNNSREITEFVLVEDGKAVGFMTKSDLNEVLSGRYGFTLHSNKTIRSVANDDFLQVNYNMPINRVSRLAMQRSYESMYNPIIVEQEGKYTGVVTIKDLLETCMQVKVDIAMNANPLTGLPGNQIIEQEIAEHVLGDAPYCITYYDLDNFKAYNDAYGFQSGDLMLAMFADVLKVCAKRYEFIGHIGGDDFIVICDYHEGDEYCEDVIAEFSKRVTSLYCEEDVKNGYIVSKNRNGVTENFPIASVSIAGISNKNRDYKDINNFSNDIAKIKKSCKRQVGNYYEIF